MRGGNLKICANESFIDIKVINLFICLKTYHVFRPVVRTFNYTLNQLTINIMKDMTW